MVYSPSMQLVCDNIEPHASSSTSFIESTAAFEGGRDAVHSDIHPFDSKPEVVAQETHAAFHQSSRMGDPLFGNRTASAGQLPGEAQADSHSGPDQIYERKDHRNEDVILLPHTYAEVTSGKPVAVVNDSLSAQATSGISEGWIQKYAKHIKSSLANDAQQAPRIFSGSSLRSKKRKAEDSDLSHVDETIKVPRLASSDPRRRPEDPTTLVENEARVGNPVARRRAQDHAMYQLDSPKIVSVQVGSPTGVSKGENGAKGCRGLASDLLGVLEASLRGT